ncbi:PstS family phosphate ABC transporter substrate-binding protein [Halobacterium salinarum]|uniref:Phosphate transport system substrate-binding protein n=4 Tax=Halobacterium salinarum TaxID=2242 RepID=A0A841HA42_HALSI|nr:PstS family phosphate ABC transporter substrate-binding protein [Halobacterium salinarum]AAG18998.1 phosphate ABC transporter periplasmic phosphate-binding [Halobacterium salinarum NRC-1]MBB6089831.1 phosphate transport system substrate-binding protein [Halobacterium salinarum]MDL0120546.1 PstS family phosphate ABC transporter substrate-binding protein [Halobacterium salinarum]MDL0125201.1 PstS family phosphate ABC transporter substrate-binding protein [Halobacterium salinarum]MDL0129626.1 
MPADDAERTTRTRRQVLAGMGATGAAALAGCQSTSSEDPADDSLSGTVDFAGSSTVFPLATTMSEAFRGGDTGEAHPDVNFNPKSTGTGGGFANHFCTGNADLNNASREVRDAEAQQCTDNDIEPVEFTVATDALTVIVNTDLDIDSITVDELRSIWSAERDTEQWSDVNPDWPDEPLELYGPSSASGTYDYFIESILHGGDTELTHISGGSYTGTEQDRTIIQGVEGSTNAMGYLGYAYYSKSDDRVKALAVDDGDGEPVKPSLETARSGAYTPLSRPLFTYAAKSSLAEPAVAAFLRFWLEHATSEAIVADQVGYVPLSQEAQREQLDALTEAIDAAGSADE